MIHGRVGERESGLRARSMSAIEEAVVAAAEAAVNAAVEATASSGDDFGERLEAMAAKLSAAARAGVKKARAEAKAAPVRVEKEAEPAPKRAKVDSSLNIRIRDQSGEETFYKVKKTTKLEIVFSLYAQRKGVDALDLRFLFNGQRVRDDETPQDLDMEDGDQIDCILEQQGDIGTFGAHAGSPGLAFLQPGAKIDDAPAAVFREIEARCRRGGSEDAAPYFASFPAAGLLSAA